MHKITDRMSISWQEGDIVIAVENSRNSQRSMGEHYIAERSGRQIYPSQKSAKPIRLLHAVREFSGLFICDGYIPYSSLFDDVYYSREGGLAESEYVFLQQNSLPEAWAERSQFTIGELGLGTGLNFLTTWQLWCETCLPGAILNYVSFEKYPLRREELLRAHVPWEKLRSFSSEFIDSLPEAIPGFHRRFFPQKSDRDNDRNNCRGGVFLTVVYGDANEMLPNFDGLVNAWYLDGFAPAKNPELWNVELFRQIARCSFPEASIATFSCARLVRDNLAAAGFEIELRHGFGKKRQMLCGHFKSEEKKGEPEMAKRRRCSPKTAIVIGGGLAGCLNAMSLAQRGVHVQLFESEGAVARKTSGNAAGVLMPYPTAEPSVMGKFYLSGYEFAWGQIEYLCGLGREIEYDRCGVVRLAINERLENLAKKFSKLNFPGNFASVGDAAELSGELGLEVLQRGFSFPSAGWVSPGQYCKAALGEAKDSLELVLNKKACAIKRSGKSWQVFDDRGESLGEAECLILANAHSCRELLGDYSPFLTGDCLRKNRGQVLFLRPNAICGKLKRILCHSGYLLPEHNGCHLVGATYQRGNDSFEPDLAGNEELLDKLCQAVSELDRSSLEVESSRVGFRTTTRDRLPCIGQIADYLYLNVGHASRGLVSCGISGELIASVICGDPLPLASEVVKALDPMRFANKT